MADHGRCSPVDPIVVTPRLVSHRRCKAVPSSVLEQVAASPSTHAINLIKHMDMSCLHGDASAAYQAQLMPHLKALAWGLSRRQGAVRAQATGMGRAAAATRWLNSLIIVGVAIMFHSSGSCTSAAACAGAAPVTCAGATAA